MSDLEFVNWERELSLFYYKHYGITIYHCDENGNEYWYVENDNLRHYTNEEG